MTDTTGTVHIVDDNAAYRAALGLVLEASGFVVKLYENAVAFLAEAPDASGCLLTDIRMPGMDGLALQQQIGEKGIPVSIIVMTGQGDVPIAVQAMKAGAVDFLEKPFDDDQLVGAVNRALEENARLLDTRAKAADANGRLATLTPREREVLDRLAAGLSNKEIARDLGSSPRTVEVQRARVMEKLDVQSLPALVHLVLAVRPKET